VAKAVMPQSAYDFSIRESLQRNRKVGLAVAMIMILVAAGVATHYLWPHGKQFDPSKAFYTEDDGRTYFVDSVYNFPPFDHNGKTAVEAVVAVSDGHYFVGYLLRYKPEARKELQEKYDDAVKNNLPLQKTVLDAMGAMSGQMEGKLPGPGHPWVPNGRIPKLDVRSPDGKIPDRYIDNP
jgi:hypothetical protein